MRLPSFFPLSAGASCSCSSDSLQKKIFYKDQSHKRITGKKYKYSKVVNLSVNSKTSGTVGLRYRSDAPNALVI